MWDVQGNLLTFTSGRGWVYDNASAVASSQETAGSKQQCTHGAGCSNSLFHWIAPFQLKN
jgi:hypothetical protein